MLSSTFGLVFWVLHLQSSILPTVNLPPAPDQCQGPDSALPSIRPLILCCGGQWPEQHTSPGVPHPRPIPILILTPGPASPEAPTPSVRRPSSHSPTNPARPRLPLAHSSTACGRSQHGGPEHCKGTSGHRGYDRSPTVQPPTGCQSWQPKKRRFHRQPAWLHLVPGSSQI